MAPSLTIFSTPNCTSAPILWETNKPQKHAGQHANIKKKTRQVNTKYTMVKDGVTCSLRM